MPEALGPVSIGLGRQGLGSGAEGSGWSAQGRRLGPFAGSSTRSVTE